MPVSVKFGTPAITEVGDQTYVNFDDGTQLEMPAGQDGIQTYVADHAVTVEQVRAIAIANRLANDPLLDSPALWNGKTVTVDLEQAVPGNIVKVV